MARAREDRAAGGGHALFETAIGRCGIAWSAEGLTAVALPEKSEDETMRRLASPRSSARRTLRVEAAAAEIAALPTGPAPAWAKRAMRRIAAPLGGEMQRFDDVPLDASRVPPFHARVYEAARALAPGETVTYGE